MAEKLSGHCHQPVLPSHQLDVKKKEVRAQKKIYERFKNLLMRQKQKVIEGKPRTMTETANTLDWAFSKLFI